jgi:CoA-transferase family III
MLDLLHGIRVVSFNHFLFGPMGIQALADLGADVIAIESTEGAWQRHWSSGDVWHDGQSVLHLCTNRNKRSILLPHLRVCAAPTEAVRSAAEERERASESAAKREQVGARGCRPGCDRGSDHGSSINRLIPRTLGC